MKNIFIRRCAVVFIEPREVSKFSIAGIFSGGPGLCNQMRWYAWAPHLRTEQELSPDWVVVLGTFSPTEWVEFDPSDQGRSDAITGLLKIGLLVSKASDSWESREDATLRETHWWPMAALLHRFSQWSGVDGVRSIEEAGLATAKGLCEQLGLPPKEAAERVVPTARLPLKSAAATEFDQFLRARATCRNFDASTKLPLELLSQMLQRLFAAQAVATIGNGATFIKKNVPSGGGLHAMEAYLIVQHVHGIASGLFHYHALEHALEPISLSGKGLEELSLEMLAGQHWFANAHVLIVLAPRFERSYWKYRSHQKAYRAMLLDAGHISQLMYTCATEMGLGAFVTSAINEDSIDAAFGLHPMRDGAIAVCGFGVRGNERINPEFDPAGAVWNT
jgi:putative peptide maturation dehydrogenase